MKVLFSKYQGTGNDFIILDNTQGEYSDIAEEQIRFMCHRRKGIGADGLMLLNLREGYDFEMIYFNADGRRGSMCGNGGRCIVKFAVGLGMKQNVFSFLASDGPHEAKIDLDKQVSLRMNDVDEVAFKLDYFILNTGSPHFVRFVNDADAVDVFFEGAKIRNNKAFKVEGINVNFVQKTGKDSIYVRTYERGVEDETLSCGTGVTASALVAAHNENGFNRVEVKTQGGDLSVDFEKVSETKFRDIWLSGPAVFVFEGAIDLKE